MIRWPLKRRQIATTIEIDKTWNSYFRLGGHILHDLQIDVDNEEEGAADDDG